ncbi:hypothetical protein [Methanoculleus thermophilus]|nr:hypothetical protein [Methanoculleus thermophilus]
MESVVRLGRIAVDDRVQVAGGVGNPPHHTVSRVVEVFSTRACVSPYPGRVPDREPVVFPPVTYTTEEAVRFAKGPTTYAPSWLPPQQAPAVSTLVAMPVYDKEAYIAEIIADAQKHIAAALAVDDVTTDFCVLSRRVIEPTIISGMLEDHGNAIDDNRVHSEFIHTADEIELEG